MAVKYSPVYLLTVSIYRVGQKTGLFLEVCNSRICWHRIAFYTVSQKKFPPFNSSYLCQILTDYQTFCSAGKRLKFRPTTKPIRRYPTQLRHVATLPWEIKNSNFLQLFSRYGKMQTYCIAFLKIQISADIQPIWKKMQAYCIRLWLCCSSTNFDIFGA